ncbi:MAG: DUF4830 domain-containing protein [Oscillospiraceae bacterium]|nr:DUF4830 domain-containing protein [Oscillospiraceae bacterium]
MFIYTTKLTRKKLSAVIGAAGALICGLILIFATGGRAQESSTDMPDGKNIKTEQSRIDYLQSYGWEIDKESEISQEVIIPREFDEMFEEYNSLQKEQGFDLRRQRGKRVMRYVYTIKNHPQNREIVYASVLIYKKKVVGGDVQCPAMDGFMHGLAMPQTGK